ILRLGRSEIIAGRSPPKWVVHHGVNLAKRYSTEKSPAFVNALLDKILRQVTAPAAADPPASESVADAVVPGADDPTPPPT
ncbi:MAG TPA: transcription antitermination factor NusB, partial [Phycisphaerales bacterium]|nr:transcription antitermination factor NusB [Phycisphaerales bacterium]